MWRPRLKHSFRIASLVVPSWLAWWVAFSTPHPGALTRAVALGLGPLWMLVAAALIFRTSVIVLGNEEGRRLERIDVLTSSGAALAWTSSLAIMASVWLGWASLAVVGVLGSALLYVVVLWAFVALRGLDPMRAASVTRRFSSEVVTEGEEVVEEIRLDGPRIPVGFRLFVTARIGPRWPTSRHVVEASESGAEIVLESEIGPAVRGEHEAEPVEAWLVDGFGLCRSPRMQLAPARIVVNPRLRAVEKTKPLLDRGMGPRTARVTRRLPTEGAFELREYRQGDDVRRIHWVRSQAAGELVVRLPDEIPPDRPRVRVVLDTFFPEAMPMTCDAPSDLLDALVATWLAVGRAIAESGARVTLVAAVPRSGDVVAVRQELMLRAPSVAQRLGAEIVWQDRVPTEQLVSDEATYIVSRGVLMMPPERSDVRWVVVLPTLTEPAWPNTSGATLPFPIGTPANGWSDRREVESELEVARCQHAQAVIAMRTNVCRPPPGSFAAYATATGAIHLEALS